MKTNSYIFGLLLVVGAVLAAVSSHPLTRTVAVIVVAAAAVLLGIDLGSKPFKR